MSSLTEIVFKHLNKDATPQDLAPDGLACAETVSTLLQEYLKERNMEFPIILDTKKLLSVFETRTDLFERVYEPIAEGIVICATGTNTRPDLLPHGHAGIYINDTQIASNSSRTGSLEINYTRETWRSLFHYYGGYPVKIFRLKNLV